MDLGPVLADHFLRQFNTEYGRSIAMSAETRRAFTDYAWPGNTRELENAVRRMVVLGSAPARPEPVRGPEAELAVPAPAVAPGWVPPTAPTSLKAVAREAAREAEVVVIRDVLDRANWNRTKAARLLKISYRTLLYKIGGYGLARLPAGDTERFVA